MCVYSSAITWCRPVGAIEVDGVTVSFLHRDAALVNDQEHQAIRDLVAAEREALRGRAEETLVRIEFISNDVEPLPRYNTVSDVSGVLE